MTDANLGRHVGATHHGVGTPQRPAARTADHQPARAAHRSRTADLTGRVEALERALAVGGDRLTPGVRTGVTDAVAAVRARLALGVDHALVAFVGGTGSGKSSLFNAVCGLPFADVGVRRPTTSEVTACVWGAGGGSLLDWLGVADQRRFQRETVLDGEAEADLRGLVLLDLPDHDSVEGAHRAVVDRLLPMVDLLVWVVDPQKYADDALHTGYLRGLVGQEAAMVVVLNQVDTVPVDVRGGLAADVSRLLAEDGLTGVPVLTTSAVTGAGLPDLRGVLARIVAGPSTAAVRAGAEVTAAAGLLARDVARREPQPDDLPTAAVVDGLAHAAGVPATADAVAASVRGARVAVPALAGVHSGAVELARRRWLSDVAGGLPQPWRTSIADRVPPADVLRRAVDGALLGVPVDARRSGPATALTALGVLSAVAAVLLGAVLVTRVLADVPALDGAPWLDTAAVPAAVLAVLAVVLFAVAALVRRRVGRARADAVRAAGRSVLEDVVGTHLADPSLALLAEHRQVRHLALTAAQEPTSFPQPAVPVTV